MKNLMSILLVFAINVVKADYVPIDFISLINRADKIAYGEIICVDEKVFELKVTMSLKKSEKFITIGKFEDWTCAVRWSDYFVGQEIMVFLAYKEKVLFPIGAGNEGEIPIFSDKAYPNIISWPFDYGELKKIKPLPQYKRYDSELYMGIEIDLNFLWQYVTTIKECFKFESNNFNKVKSAEWTCPTEKMGLLSKQSDLYRQTFKRLKTNVNTVYN